MPSEVQPFALHGAQHLGAHHVEVAVRRVDVLEGDDVVPRQQPRLGLEGRELGPGRADRRRRWRGRGRARLPGRRPSGAAPSPRCSLAFWIAA